MNGSDRPGMIGDEARLELAMAAANAERSNRPRHLVLAAAVALLISLVYLFVAMGSRASAASKLEHARIEIVNLEKVVGDVLATTQVGSSDRYAPNSRVIPYLEKFASHVGLPPVEVKPGTENTAGPEGFIQRAYRAVVTEQDPALLLQWVERVSHGEPLPENDKDPPPPPAVGLDISSIKLTPGRTNEDGKVLWSLDINFKRWERKE
jgi:hypothetical protein